MSKSYLTMCQPPWQPSEIFIDTNVAIMKHKKNAEIETITIYVN